MKGGREGKGTVAGMMSPDYRSRLLHRLRFTRVLFGLTFSAFAILVWLRMDVPQLWPKLVAVPSSVAVGSPAVSKSEFVVHFFGLKSMVKVTNVANVSNAKDVASNSNGSDRHTLDVMSVSNVSDVRDTSGLLNVSDVSDVSDTSDVFNVSYVSDARDVSDASNVRDVLNVPDVRDALGVLNGLAVDRACLSRSQQYGYRLDEYGFPLSDSFRTALQNYANMFARCAPAAFPGTNPSCRYLLYFEGWEGLGNRLLSLVSAFTYALLTNRALLTVSNRGHLGSILCEPFPNATWLLPAPVANTVLSQAVSLEAATASQFSANITAVHLSLRHSHPAGVLAFFNSGNQQALQTVPWVIWESNQYYTPRFFLLPDFWPTLTSWFPDVSRVFTQLGRVLCVPKNSLWSNIRAIQDAERVQVGIQLRRHGFLDDAGFREQVYRRIVGCVKDIVPERSAVLVTSLQSVYWEKIRERWNATANVKFVMVSHEGAEQYSLEQAQKAMVEIWLLSFCKTALATSGWSTFGYVAQGLAGMRPTILNIRDGELLYWESACTFGQSPEPCLHFPFTNSAISSNSTAAPPTGSNNEINHWAARHLLGCQDEPNGLQLVSL